MSPPGVAVIGTPADARGFRLAGVPAYPCVTRQDVEAALRTLMAANATAPALLLVSAPVHALAPELFDALAAPIVLALPDVPDGVAARSELAATGVGHRSDTAATWLRAASQPSSSI